MLNTDYKIATKCIAKRLEKVLPVLINRDQTGYIKNRFIGENIRLISDIIDSYDEDNLPGFLLFIDFEKAFDSLEWSFLFKSLEVMNFGPMFQRWIRTFYSNISSCVINNGYTTSFFSLQRGVRQGCPLSGLLFVLAIEFLAQSVRESNVIQGLSIGNKEVKLSLYADDITALVRDETSAHHLFVLLKDFENSSGLKINLSKTEGMWLGSSKCNIGKKTLFGISWPKDYIIAPGVAFAYDSSVSKKINFDEKLSKLKSSLNCWTTRNLTLLGRINIVKTLGISKLVYNTSVLVMPPNFDKDVNNACFWFVWNFKPDKIKRSTLIGSFDKGGLQMVDFSTVNKGLKAAWVKRIYESKDCNWCALFLSALRKYGSNLLLESNYNVEDLNLTKVLAFYKTV